VKHKKLKNKGIKQTLASVTKEMAGPRFAESVRKAEEANHGATQLLQLQDVIAHKGRS
jgi:hypothetical protein